MRIEIEKAWFFRLRNLTYGLGQFFSNDAFSLRTDSPPPLTLWLFARINSSELEENYAMENLTILYLMAEFWDSDETYRCSWLFWNMSIFEVMNFPQHYLIHSSAKISVINFSIRYAFQKENIIFCLWVLTDRIAKNPFVKYKSRHSTSDFSDTISSTVFLSIVEPTTLCLKRNKPEKKDSYCFSSGAVVVKNATEISPMSMFIARFLRT